MTTTGTEEEKFSIPPFDRNSDEYSVWAFKMRSYLVSQGYWDVVECTTVAADIDTSDDMDVIAEEKARRRAERMKLDAKAIACIVLKLNKTQTQLVMRLTTAKAIWNTLAVNNRMKTLANSLFV